jgi:hypothetical protein
MRKDEKHLFEIPAQRLSNLSHLVKALRENDEVKLNTLKNYARLVNAVKYTEFGSEGNFEEVVADLIMEAVYETRFAEVEGDVK